MTTVEFRYRKHLRLGQYIVPGLSVVFIMFWWGMTRFFACLAKAPDYVLMTLTALGAVITFFFGLQAILFWFFFRRFTKVSVAFDGETIVYKNIKSERVFKIEDIARLEFPSVPYTGGWLKIVNKDGHTIRLTVVLEGIGRFIKGLKEALDAKGNTEAYAGQNIFGFYKTAEFSDQSWERLYSYFKWLVLWSILNLGVGIGLVNLLTLSHPLSTFIIFGSGIGPFLTYAAGDFVIANRIAKLADEISFSCPERDQVFEANVYKRVGIIYGALYLVVSLIVGLMGS